MNLQTATTLDTQPKVLFVDDEPFILATLKRLFRNSQLDVTVANNGEEAIKLIEEQHFDLVMSDMRMPGKSGTEVLKSAAELQPQSQRILLTGYSDLNTTIEAINLGHVHQYVSKPWNDQALKDVLEACLQTIATQKLQQLHTRQLNRCLRRQMHINKDIEINQFSAIQKSRQTLQTNLGICVQFFSQITQMRLPARRDEVPNPADIVNQVGISLGLNDTQRQHLYMAALFRHIGKSAFPDALIKTPFEKLTATQKKAYQQHPNIGAKYFASHTQFEQVALIVQQHREFCNGTGFPKGLKSESICMEAKILCAVCDYCDWQTTELKSHSKTAKEAINALKKQSHKHYDSRVVEAITYLMETQIDQSIEVSEQRMDCHELLPGMMTSANIVNKLGHLLLAQGTVLDQGVIDKLIDIETSLGDPLFVSVID
ncbi:MAG: response regulator [Pseudomonadales bacterium]|nr:response regulator [Pseudomonadales bacterium]